MNQRNTRSDALGHGKIDTGIVEAAFRNDLIKVRQILTANPTAVNEQDTNGLSALMASAGRGHLRIVEEICAHSDVDWRLRDAFGRTALDFSYGHPDTCDYLIEMQFGKIELNPLEIV